MSKSKEEELFWAALEGELEKVKSLCSDPAVNVNWQRESNGCSPFYVACHKGQVEVVKYLLSLKGIDPGLPAINGATPFYISCQLGHKEVVSLLLADPRIDPLFPVDGEFTPFYIASSKGDIEVISLLLADPRIDPNKALSGGGTAFLKACQDGDKEVVSLLLANPRVDPNMATNEGATGLYMCAQCGFLEIIQTILASSREVDTKRRIVTEDPVENGKTAAEWARTLGTIQKPEYMEGEAYERVRKLGSTIADLIDAYEKDPAKVRSQLRKQLGPRGISSRSPFPP